MTSICVANSWGTIPRVATFGETIAQAVMVDKRSD
jgi:hypothetical protein